MHQNKYIEHLEGKVAGLQLQNDQLRQEMDNTGGNRADDSELEPSNVTGITGFGVGRPEIDAMSAMSFEAKFRGERRNGSVLDSEVKGMEKFA